MSDLKLSMGMFLHNPAREEMMNALLAVDINRCVPNEHWKKLFDFYNSQVRSPVSMSCRPCFYKVYQYVTRALMARCFCRTGNEEPKSPDT